MCCYSFFKTGNTKEKEQAGDGYLGLPYPVLESLDSSPGPACNSSSLLGCTIGGRRGWKTWMGSWLLLAPFPALACIWRLNQRTEDLSASGSLSLCLSNTKFRRKLVKAAGALAGLPSLSHGGEAQWLGLPGLALSGSPLTAPPLSADSRAPPDSAHHYHLGPSSP